MDVDLLNQPYGRFYYLAYYLAKFGHQVEMILLSYRVEKYESIKDNNLTMHSVSLFPNPLKAFHSMYQLTRNNNPDWILGFSDIYYGIMAQYFSRKIKTKYLIDAYDNYESYIPFLYPMHWLWRQAVKNADLVTCAGASIETLFRQHRTTGKIKILPMTTDDNKFFPLDKKECRAALNLPQEKKLIGYNGSISHSRDIRFLFKTIEQLRLKDPDIMLVMSGRKYNNVQIPSSVNYLGYLNEIEVVKFMNSIDVLAVPNKLSSFGHYSHPIKIYEAIACGIPIVATRTKSTQWILRSYPSSLVTPGKLDEFVESLSAALTLDKINYDELPSWKDLADNLNQDLIQYI